MFDDEVDRELLELLKRSLGLYHDEIPIHAQTGVLKDAELVSDNSIDVALDSRGTKAAANTIWTSMQEKNYSAQAWSEHELHPKTRDESTVDFIFMMDLLNFSFWSEKTDLEARFAVEYRGKLWTGYWSLVAALQRALEEDIPITSPSYWIDETACTDEKLKHVFRSATPEPMPLLEERISVIREAGMILHDQFKDRFLACISQSNGSAASLVNLIVDRFPCFRDEIGFEGKTIRFYKRAQILVADLWACFEGESYGKFDDIDTITMFADYRVPQMLYTLGCLKYSPRLDHHIRQLQSIKSGDTWEIELRGCSIWAVELLQREIKRQHPDAKINAILIDFFLYDSMKALESDHHQQTTNTIITASGDLIPHHRTRSIWY